MVQILHVTVGPETRGHGTFPAHDPWGNAFSRRYHPDRFAKAGTPIGGYLYYCGILEGIQSDLDFLRCMFDLQRTSARQVFCHLCDSLQWLSLKIPLAHSTIWSLFTLFMGLVREMPKLFQKKIGYKFMAAHPSAKSLVGTQKEPCLPLLFCHFLFFWNLDTSTLNRNLVVSVVLRKTILGLFPDYMHIIHLAVAVDSISSVLLDLSEPTPGNTRDALLAGLWESYKQWCDSEGHFVCWG